MHPLTEEKLNVKRIILVFREVYAIIAHTPHVWEVNMHECPVCGMPTLVRQGNCHVCQLCGFSFCEVGNQENIEKIDIDKILSETLADGGETWEEKENQQLS